MGTRREHADIIHAWAEGADIEILDNGQWIDAKTPNFCAMYEYRVKPKTLAKKAEVLIYKTNNGAYESYVNFGNYEVEMYNVKVVKRLQVEWEEEQ